MLLPVFSSRYLQLHICIKFGTLSGILQVFAFPPLLLELSSHVCVLGRMHSYSHSQSVPLKFVNDYLYIVLSNVITLNLAKNTEP